MRRAAALIAAHAALFAAAFHHPWLWPLAWVCLVPEVWLIRDGTARQAVMGTGISHFFHGLLTVYWLAYTGFPLRETMGAGPAPWLGTAAGFGLYGLFYGALARPLARSAIPTWIWLPFLWTGVECLQGKLFFFAFPWMWLGHSQLAVAPLVQVADLGGALLVSFLVAAGNGGIVDRRPWPFALVLAALGYGAWRMAALEVVPGPRVLAVQPWFPQSVKNETEFNPRARLTKLRELTLRALREAEAARGALRYAALDRVPELRAWLAGFGAPVLAGSVHVEPREGRIVEHNSAFLVSAAGEVLGRYDKIFLAPMSEETPFYETWPALHRLLRETFVPPDFSQFERGKDAAVFSIDGPGGPWKIAPSICFDITFSEATNRAVRKGADAIVNVSNYAWFADSLELDLARAQTLFRAVETRRGIVSVVNGGITHFVDPRGRIVDLTGPGGKRKEVEGTLLRELVTSRARTLFVALPTDLFGWLCFAAGAGTSIATIARRRRRRPGAP